MNAEFQEWNYLLDNHRTEFSAPANSINSQSCQLNTVLNMEDEAMLMTFSTNRFNTEVENKRFVE